MLTEKQAIEILRRAQSQIRKWQEKYGEASPDWLPPAGDVRLLEDIDEAITSLEDDLHHFQEDNPYLKNAIRAALSEQSAPFVTAERTLEHAESELDAMNANYQALMVEYKKLKSELRVQSMSTLSDDQIEEYAKSLGGLVWSGKPTLSGDNVLKFAHWLLEGALY